MAITIPDQGKVNENSISDYSFFSGITLINAVLSSISTSHRILSPCSNLRRLVIAEGITVIIEPAFLRILVVYIIFIFPPMFFSMYISVRSPYKYLSNFLYIKPYRFIYYEVLCMYRNLYRFLTWGLIIFKPFGRAFFSPSFFLSNGGELRMKKGGMQW